MQGHLLNEVRCLLVGIGRATCKRELAGGPEAHEVA